MKAAAAAILALLAATAKPALSAPTRIEGFNFPCWWQDCYDAPNASASLAKLAETGARWVALTPTWYAASRRASSISPTKGTPTDASLRAAIRRAKALGLSVALKPHVDVTTGEGRAFIDPVDFPLWWRDYRAMILGYAKLAAEEKADLFVVGTELAGLAEPARRDDWRALIRDVRAVYAGPLTYASNSYDFVKVPFWTDLDYVGIDGYFAVPGGRNESMLRAALSAYVAPVWAVARMTGKPVLFTEFGISSQEGATIRPWDFGHFGRPDEGVQAAYLQAFLDVFGKRRWCAGLLNWAWEVDPDAGGPGSDGMTVQNKAAQKVLERWFRRDEPKPEPPRVDGAKAAGRARAVLDAGLVAW